MSVSNNALHLAIVHGDLDKVIALLEKGEAISVKNPNSWSCISLARATGSVKMTQLVARASVKGLSDGFNARLPGLLRSLEDLDDFRLTIDWKFSSWVPLTGRFCPKDTCVITKCGSSIRLDYSLFGFDNMSWQYGKLSAIFQGNGHKVPGRFAVVDWESKKVRFPVEYMGSSEFKDMSRADVASMLSNEIHATDTVFRDVVFSPKKGWFSSKPMTEDVDGRTTTVFDMSNMHVDIRSRMPPKFEWNEDETENLHVRFAEPGQPVDADLKLPGEGAIKRRRRTVGATVWCADFPLTVESLLPILELLAPTAKHFEKLSEFFEQQLPAGFPVKLDIPIVPTVSATVSFHHETHPHTDTSAFFDIPSSFEVTNIPLREEKRELSS